MKKRTVAIVLCGAVAVCLCAGGFWLMTSAQNDTTAYTDSGEIFADSTFQTQNIRTPDQAVADGCLVIVSVGNDNKLYSSQEPWEEFLTASKKGKDAGLKIVQYGDEGASYSYLQYKDGVYRYGDMNPISSKNPPVARKYLQCLKGISGGKESCAWVLTDETDLTYKDFEWYMFSSNSEVLESTPFQWLGFTVYLDEQ